MTKRKLFFILIILCFGLLQNIYSQIVDSFNVETTQSYSKQSKKYESDTNLLDFTVSYFKNNWLVRQKRFIDNCLEDELIFRGDTVIEISYYRGTSIIADKSYYLISKDSIKEFHRLNDYHIAHCYLKHEHYNKKGKIETRTFYTKMSLNNEGNEGCFSIASYTEEYKRGKLIKYYTTCPDGAGTCLTEEYKRGKLKKCYTWELCSPNGNYYMKQIKCNKGTSHFKQNVH
ncbi:MAG: hypothetical protein IT234_01560 [Bacteroidia bacterium]|nr:hypothetical protein [Bacteroidia bacterium]